jgi:hypothetical protein
LHFPNAFLGGRVLRLKMRSGRTIRPIEFCFVTRCVMAFLGGAKFARQGSAPVRYQTVQMSLRS